MNEWPLADDELDVIPPPCASCGREWFWWTFQGAVKCQHCEPRHPASDRLRALRERIVNPPDDQECEPDGIWDDVYEDY